jgi:hypothetical protein
MMVAEMDAVLHRERLASGGAAAPVLTAAEIAALPDGSMVAVERKPFAVMGGQLLPWTFGGYGVAERLAHRRATLVTPHSVITVLRQGYEPIWHQSSS